MVKRRQTAEAAGMAAAVGAAKDGDTAVPTSVMLSSGVVLAIQPVTPMMVRAATGRIQRPDPPVVHIEEKGRSEENPNDPGYLKAMAEYVTAVDETGVDVVLLVGTSIEQVPDGVYRPEEDGWVGALQKLRHFGVEHDLEDPDDRYLAWLRYYAIRTAADLRAVLDAPRKGLGLTEEEVAEAVDSFRDPAARSTDNES